MRVQREDVDHWQVLTFTHFMVIEIVRRGDLHTTGAFFHVSMFVSYDRNTTAHQRQFDKLANQRLVTRIFRIHRHCGITQHGFRTRGRHDQVIFTFCSRLTIRQRIAQMPHVAFNFFVLNFQIRDRGVQFRIPVHQTLAAIDQILFIQTYEHFLHRMRQRRVHGERFTIPVYRSRQTAHLTGDGAAGFFLPLPDLVDEGFTAIIVTGLTFFRGDLTFHHHLGRDTRMVSTYLPQGIFTQHALITDQGIHDGLLESMAHVQATGDVWRRDHDAVIAVAAVATRFEIALAFPVLVHRLFNGVRIKRLFHLSSSV